MPIYPFDDRLPRIDASAFIHPDAVIIGDVTIGAETSVWPGVVIRGDVNHVHIGQRTNIQDGSILHVTRPSTAKPEGVPLIIGDDVVIGHGVNLHACRLENGCMIGIGAIVLDGATVESRAMVAAGSLVTPGKTVNGGSLWTGSPARHKRPLSETEKNGIAATCENYIRLSRLHRQGRALPGGRPS